MSNPGGSSGSGADDRRKVAGHVADQIVPLIRRAQASGLGFLAYLLAMALEEARRVSEM
jgi:hypothetical protein